MKATAIIVAAGSGTRFGAEIPKALVKLFGKPLVRWSAEVFCEIDTVESLIVIAPIGFEKDFRNALAGLNKKIKITAGGQTRTDSVRNGISILPSDCDIVAIHDAARPLISSQEITAVLLAAEKHGAATLATPVSDTLKLVEKDFIIGTVDRTKFWGVQTPQVFRRAIIEKALSASLDSSSTDDCALVETIGYPIYIVKGSRRNIKITYPEDLEIAEAVIAQNRKVDE
jgi:2-C-methyl-D-erythritol 4-phosphate cytidylyltransferase